MKKMIDYMKAHAMSIMCWILLAFVSLFPIAAYIADLSYSFITLSNLGESLALLSLGVSGPVAMLVLLIDSRRTTRNLEAKGESQLLWKKVLGIGIAALGMFFVMECFEMHHEKALPFAFSYCVVGLLLAMGLLRKNGAFRDDGASHGRVRRVGYVFIVMGALATALLIIVRQREAARALNLETLDLHADAPYAFEYDLDPYFAKLPPRARSEADVEWPSFPGIERASFLESCPEDSSFRKRLVLLIGSPKERRLLEWVNEYVSYYLDDIGYERPRCLLNPVSAENIADSYMEQAREMIRTGRCRRDPEDADAVTEQNALFVGVTMLDDEVCTFMTHSWYDQPNIGHGITRSWYTIMRCDGKELKFRDLIAEECEDAFLDLLVENLGNNAGLLEDHVGGDVESCRKRLLSCMDGCALVEDGLLVYYHPHSLGSGVDGQLSAVIPNDDLLTVIRTDCPAKGWLSRAQRE